MSPRYRLDYAPYSLTGKVKPFQESIMLLRHARSLLFLPASNARAITKARSLPCDMVILDLEDAVPDEAKADARAGAVARRAQRSIVRCC